MNAITRLPAWAKIVLGFALLPLTICYGIYVMWRQQRFASWTRVAVTALGGLLVFGIVATAATSLSTSPVVAAPATNAASIPATAAIPVPVPAVTTANPSSTASTPDTQPAPDPDPAATSSAAAIVAPVAAPPAPAAAPAQAAPLEATVYTTNTGAKYHATGCRFLAKSRIASTLSAAKAAGLTPCSVCAPPQ